MSSLAAMLERARAHHSAGRLQEAESAYRDVLTQDPHQVEALNNLGSLLESGGDFAAAIGYYEQAILRRPDLPQLHFNLANALSSNNAPQRALSSYQQAIRLAPRFAMVHNNLGLLQKALGDFDGAEASLREAARLEPGNAETLANLGALQQQRGDLAGAQASFQRACELRSDAAALNNLGEIHLAQRDWIKARQYFADALRGRPNYARPHCNLGQLCMAEGDDEAALRHFDQALAIDPACPEAHANRGVVFLSRGDYDAGWPEYAWYQRSAAFVSRKPQWSLWNGEPLEGRTILVYGEHGLGDALQFVRLLPELRRRGAARVLLGVPKALHPLLSQSGIQDLVQSGEALPKFDVAASLLELPCLLRISDDTIPAPPYLWASPAQISHWQPELQSLGPLRVGIAWQGNRNYAWDHFRSIPLRCFEPLAKVAGVQLISLQIGDGREQISEVAGRFSVKELSGVEHRTLMDTAAIVEHLDLVITSDTSVAHLAGALGSPVWIALSRGADWRWQRVRSTTAWYPRARLYRQTTIAIWDDVFAAMARELSQLAAQRCK